MTPAGLRHALTSAVKRAGINKEVNLHILRHCFASHALEEGMNLKTLQYLLAIAPFKPRWYICMSVKCHFPKLSARWMPGRNRYGYYGRSVQSLC